MKVKTAGPRLRTIRLLRDRVQDWSAYPFNLPVVRSFSKLELTSRVCFFVGENGSGKSTLLEGIAAHCGFGREGGSKHIGYETAVNQNRNIEPLVETLRLSWTQKIVTGYFFRAESFFNIATYLDDLGPIALEQYGGRSLHLQSHGESLLALFENRFFPRGFYILDEPEAALSPQRQLSFLLILHRLLHRSKENQFIIATHSPILLAFPGSQIISFDGPELKEIAYRDTEPYQITSGFLANPELYLRELFAELPFEE